MTEPEASFEVSIKRLGLFSYWWMYRIGPTASFGLKRTARGAASKIIYHARRNTHA